MFTSQTIACLRRLRIWALGTITVGLSESTTSVPIADLCKFNSISYSIIKIANCEPIHLMNKISNLRKKTTKFEILA